MKKYKNHTLSQYVDVLSAQKPVPGGGSAAAYAGALGAALIGMVARYSEGRNSSKLVERKIKSIIRQSVEIQNKLMDYVDLDAEAYQKVVNARKNAKERLKAERQARKIPKQICKLCYKAITLTPYLVENGNVHLISDIEVAVEMLFASYNSALILSKV